MSTPKGGTRLTKTHKVFNQSIPKLICWWGLLFWCLFLLCSHTFCLAECREAAVCETSETQGATLEGEFALIFLRLRTGEPVRAGGSEVTLVGCLARKLPQGLIASLCLTSIFVSCPTNAPTPAGQTRSTNRVFAFKYWSQNQLLKKHPGTE